MEFLSASFQKLNIWEKKYEVSGTLAIYFLHAAADSEEEHLYHAHIKVIILLDSASFDRKFTSSIFYLDS